MTDNLDGMFTYSANGAFEHLAIGQQATDTFTYAVDDGSGGVDTEVVTITVEGANDAPRNLTTPDTDAETLAETGVPLTVSSSLTFSDVDISDSVTAAVTGFTASGATAVLAGIPSGDLLGMLTLDTPNVLSGVENLARRRWTFDSGTTIFTGLSLGESLVLTYTVTATDVRGAEATHDIDITIEGRNNVPTISIDPALPFLEQSDAAAQVLSQSGTLTFDNVDLGDTIDVTYSINGAPIWSGDTLTAAQATALAEGFSTGATGATTPGTIPWTYDATLDLDFLGAGETITFSYRIVVDDFGGSLASDIVTFTITGTNDAPVLVADRNGNDLVTEAGTLNPGDPSATGKLLINDSDADAHDTLPLSSVDGSAANIGTAVAGTYGSLLVDAAGNWTYTLDDADADTEALADPFGAPGQTMTVAGTNGGVFTVRTDGAYSFDTNGAFDALAVGEFVNTSITYTVTDSNGGTDTAEINVAVRGRNDQPVTAADENGGDAVVEAGVATTGYALANGNVLANDTDPDTSHVLRVLPVNADDTNVGAAVAGLYGSVVIEANGDWTYTLDDLNPATNALAEGQVVTETFNYVVNDGLFAADIGTLTNTITGSNDAPVAADSIQLGTEDGSVVDRLLSSDPDSAGPLTHVVESGPSHGSVSMNADGSYTYTPDANWSGTGSFQYRATDGLGAFDVGTEIVQIEAVADVPTVSLAPPGTATYGFAGSGTDQPVSTAATDGDTAEAVAALEGGGYVVAWQSFGQDGSRHQPARTRIRSDRRTRRR
ncbi:VCBS domain-containing protein [Sagittula stellata]|uniref:VCBS protein n=1 Tax=Sagittula stellata (strain ATCC 700073 / DSM 11524 / E-37) TaxID=388399 RepID=A3KBA4_SAGS3|nr:VCBS domain-containing protein [Sagittula stellata]EBA05545.1 VCBS protein [Sagittula stellata E-37]